MKIKRIAHVAIAAEKMAPIKALFENLLDLPMVHESRLDNGTEVAMYGIGDMHVEVLHNANASSITGGYLEQKGTGYFHVCLEVEDLQVALAELETKGVRVHPNSPSKGAVSSSVAFLDPATTGGLLIELAEASHAAHGDHAKEQKIQEVGNNHGGK